MSGLISWRPGPGRDTHTVLSVVVSSPLRWRPCRIDHFAMVECSLCPVSLLVSLPPGNVGSLPAAAAHAGGSCPCSVPFCVCLLLCGGHGQRPAGKKLLAQTGCSRTSSTIRRKKEQLDRVRRKHRRFRSSFRGGTIFFKVSNSSSFLLKHKELSSLRGGWLPMGLELLQWLLPIARGRSGSRCQG